MPIVKRSGAPCQRPAHGRRSRLGTVTRSSTPGARTPETPPRRKHQRTTTLTTSRQTAHTQASKTQPHSTRAQHHTPRRPRRNCRVDHRPPNPSSRSTRCAQDLRRQGAPQARDCSDSSSREGHRQTHRHTHTRCPSGLMVMAPCPSCLDCLRAACNFDSFSS